MQHFLCKHYDSYNSILYYQVKVLFLAFGYSRKNQTVGDEGMEFPGVLKRENADISGVN